MAFTTFSGPVRVGPKKDGPGANLGYTICSQSAAWEQDTTAASSGIIIPAHSQVLEMALYVSRPTSAANLTIGVDDTADELVTGWALGTGGDKVLFASGATIPDIDIWINTGAEDVTLWWDSSAGTAGVDGSGVFTVWYIPSIDVQHEPYQPG